MEVPLVIGQRQRDNITDLKLMLRDGEIGLALDGSVLAKKYDGAGYISLTSANAYNVDSFASLSAALTAIGSGTATLYVTSPITIAASINIPSLCPNLHLAVPRGGSFSVASGQTLTTPTAVEAGDYQIFSGVGSVAGLYRRNVIWFGATADAVDSTAAILKAAGSGNCQLYIPFNVRYWEEDLLPTLPASVTLDDKSVINEFSSAGETAKKVGILSSDTAESDTHQYIGSGHHPIQQLNNFGTSGTASGDERKASVVWAAGRFLLGLTAKRGFRGLLIDQYTRETGGQFWKKVLRSLAPWVAVGGHHITWEAGQVIAGSGILRAYGRNLYSSTGAGTTGATPPTHSSGTVTDGGVSWAWSATLPGYELWATGQTVAIGDVRYTGSNHYIAASAGVCGATEPSHTNGTISDGTVLWTWVDTSDRSVFSFDEFGRLLIGPGPGTDTYRHKAGATDLGGNYLWWGRGQTISGAGVFRRWGNRLYESTGGGTTGTSPPIHITGNASDGTVTWTHVGTSTYTVWAAGQVISGAGVQRAYGRNLYESTGAGTTGATPPTHDSGSVSDGAVTWTRVASTNYIGANYIMDLAAYGASKAALLKLTGTNATGTEVAGPYLRAYVEPATGLPVLAVQKSNGSTLLGRWEDAHGYISQKLCLGGGVAADGDTTPSVEGIATLYLNNTGATSITAFDDPSQEQFLHVIAVNGNTTLVHSASLDLHGDVNVTIPQYGSITFRRLPSSISNRWIEVDRSFAKALTYSGTWDPGNMAADGDVVSTTVTVTGAAVGDQVSASLSSLGANSVLISAHIQAADTARIILMNKTGGAHDPGSGTLALKVWK